MVFTATCITAVVLAKVIGGAGIAAFLAGWFSRNWIIALLLGTTFGVIDGMVVAAYSVTPIFQAVIAILVGALMSLLSFFILGMKRRTVEAPE